MPLGGLLGRHRECDRELKPAARDHALQKADHMKERAGEKGSLQAALKNPSTG